jgi:uncharacterized repeat protein (TIGR03803 family)
MSVVSGEHNLQTKFLHGNVQIVDIRLTSPGRAPCTLPPCSRRPYAGLSLSIPVTVHSATRNISVHPCFCRQHAGATVDTIYTFDVAGGEGSLPYSGLIEDAAGNFYGTTFDGGAHNFGTVYRLAPNSSGGFTHAILYSFKGESTDGAEPHSSLFRDSAGNLYGTTLTRGIVGSTCNAGTFAFPIGCGIIFKLSPTTTGQWTETVLHRFSGPDGGNSFTGLIRDAAGNFYGATIAGGGKGLGVVFKLSLTSTGWKETVLHNFTGGTDGALPFIQCATLVKDASGNL